MAKGELRKWRCRWLHIHLSSVVHPPRPHTPALQNTESRLAICYALWILLIIQLWVFLVFANSLQVLLFPKPFILFTLNHKAYYGIVFL